jgi:Protein of unknown function (DUF1769)
MEESFRYLLGQQRRRLLLVSWLVVGWCLIHDQAVVAAGDHRGGSTSSCQNNNNNPVLLSSVNPHSTAVLDRLPPSNVTAWPHRPVYLQAASATRVLNAGHKKKKNGSNDDDELALPLGVPLEIDTPLFQGRILIRFRNAKSDDQVSHDAYFNGSGSTDGTTRSSSSRTSPQPGGPHHKRLMQTVVQGRFKKSISMADVYVGSIFREPIKLAPPPSLLQVIQAVLGRTTPGIVLDLASKRPRVMSLLVGGATQTIRVDTPGNEPVVTTSIDYDENIGEALLGRPFRNVRHRQRYLNHPNTASQYFFDPHKIYTFHSYSETMDYGTYTMKLPPLYPRHHHQYQLDQLIGPQPMSLAAVVPSTGETIFHFDVWHESVYRQKLLVLCDDDE